MKSMLVNCRAHIYSGVIWLTETESDTKLQPIKLDFNENCDKVTVSKACEVPECAKVEAQKQPAENKTFEEMTVEELQEAILERMKHNGPVTEQMRNDVLENIYHNSLITWIKSFN